MPQKLTLDLDRFRERHRIVSDEVAALAPGVAPRIVVVTKYLVPADTRRLIEAGFSPLGENRAPDLEEKHADGDGDAWHFIGHLQRNKLGKVLPRIGLLHSIDSQRLAESVENWLEREQRTLGGLVQVNVSGESSKGGLEPEEALARVPEWVRQFSHLRLGGLMTMAPFEDPELTRPVFRAARELRDRIREALPAETAADFSELSMGMSNDYTIATEEGATLLRLGSLLYR